MEHLWLSGATLYEMEQLMVQGATVHTFTADLADMDHGAYKRLDLRVASQPSETADFLVAHILAYSTISPSARVSLPGTSRPSGPKTPLAG